MLPIKEYTPDAVYVVPFQKNELQATSDIEDELLVFIVKFKVATESHPTAFVPLNVYTPDAVYVVPFHKNELHADSVEFDEVG
jgi:hypothetical protein